MLSYSITLIFVSSFVWPRNFRCLSTTLNTSCLLLFQDLFGLGGHARTVPKFRPFNRQNYMAGALDKLRCFDRIHPASA